MITNKCSLIRRLHIRLQMPHYSVVPVTLFSRNLGVACRFQTRSKETPGSLIQALRDDEQEDKAKNDN